jgi:hypothetical protein
MFYWMDCKTNEWACQVPRRPRAAREAGYDSGRKEPPWDPFSASGRSSPPLSRSCSRFAAPGRSRSPRSSFPRRPRGRSRTGKASRTHATAAWLRALAAGVAIVVALYAVVVLMGGLPPVHEWRGALAR